MYLSNNQILYIENDLKSKGLSTNKVAHEILDHICCLTEQQMEQGVNFSKAYETALDSFDDEGFVKLKKAIGGEPKVVRNKKLFTSSIAACILLFVFVVDAQDRPELHPLGANKKISSDFGLRIHPITKKEKFHRGVDMPTPVGTPVKVAAKGYVSEIKESKGYGKHIIIKHDDEFETLYATLSEFRVAVGDNVKKGQIIALSGNTGTSTAPHLHYEVLKNGENVDPEKYFE